MAYTIRVLIADDHAILRSGLRLLINGQPGMEVVGEAGDFDEAIRLATTLEPDVVTLDLTMPAGSGLGTIEAACCRAAVAHRRADDAGSIICSPHARRWRLGLSREGTADTGDQRSVPFIAGACSSTCRTRRRWRHRRLGPGMPAPIALLSQRSAVMTLVAEGHTNQAVAERLGLSTKTVESIGRDDAEAGPDHPRQLTRLAMDGATLETAGRLIRFPSIPSSCRGIPSPAVEFMFLPLRSCA